MVSYGILRRVALVRTEVSEEPSVCFIRVTRIGELGTTLAVTSNRRTLRRNTKYFTLMKEALGSSETSVLTRATRRNILEDTILHSHSREILKSLRRMFTAEYTRTPRKAKDSLDSSHTPAPFRSKQVQLLRHLSVQKCITFYRFFK
jgi:hypothetical protein